MLRLLFILLFLNAKCFAQNPVCRIVNNTSGLPSNTVYQIHQDKDGFIWVAHDKGLSKYDGSSFLNYKSPSMQGSSVSNIHVFGNKTWCQDFAGNYYYTKENQLFRETRLTAASNYFASVKFNDKIATVIKDSLILINGFNNKFSSFALPKFDYVTIATDNNRLLLYAKDKVLVLSEDAVEKTETFDTKKSFFFLINVNGNTYGITKNTSPYINLLKNNRVLPLNILPESLIIQDVNVTEDEIWISTSTGAYCFDKNWNPLYNKFCFYKEYSITKVIKDRENNYWFSTLNNGIFIVPNINARLYNFQNKNLTALSFQKDKILAGTSDHTILSFDLSNEHFNFFYKDKTNHEILGIKYDSVSDDIVYWSDKLGFIKNGKKVKEFSNFAVKSVTGVNEDFYAVAFASGVSLIRRNEKTTPVPEWIKTKKNNWIDDRYNLLETSTRGRCVYFDNETNTLFAATANGIYYFSPNGKGKITAEGKDIFSSQIIKHSNEIYFTTFSNGLYKLTSPSKAIPITNQYISKTLYKASSHNKMLWLIGDNLLQQYNTETDKVITYSESNGLPKAELKDIVIKDGRVFLATTQGLVIFNNDIKNKNEVAPLLYLNSISVNGKTISDSNFSFKSNENNVSIDFSLLAFKANKASLEIQYKINDEPWQNLESVSRQLNLPSLSAGTYNIQIRGFNEDGIVSENTITVNFKIANPFYKQWWFIGLVALVTLTILYIIFKTRIKNVNQRNELLAQKLRIEHELNKSTLTSIKSQMNPHFLFNALNTIQSYIYTNDKENASEYLVKFSQLTRLILDMSNKDYVSIADEIKALKLYIELEQQRFEDKLQCSFTINENISTETLYIPSMLIQPYIENAIKHGLLHKKGIWILKIDFEKQTNGIQVTIDDNGIGRKRSEQLSKNKMKHQSFATKANEKRLEILNRGLHQNIGINITDKEDAHGNALGTTVVLFIPTQNKPD